MEVGLRGYAAYCASKVGHDELHQGGGCLAQ
jgi:hypothetical protein